MRKSRILAMVSRHQNRWTAPIFVIRHGQPAVPSEKGIWFSDTGDFLQRFPPQTLADLGQRGPLAIGQAESRLEVRFQNAVLRREIFVLQKEFDSAVRHDHARATGNAPKTG